MPSPLVMAAGAVATFLVGFIASPIMELLKSSLLAKSLQSERKRELIARLRIMLGYITAFGDCVSRAVPNESSFMLDEDEPAAWKEVQAFSFDSVRQFGDDLIRLELEISATSGVGQSLVKRIILFSSAAEQVKLIEPIYLKVYDGVESTGGAGEKFRMRLVEKLGLPEEAKPVISHFKRCELSLRRFIAGPYAQKLGVDGFSLVVDPDIAKFDEDMAAHDLAMTLSKLRRASDELQQKRDS